MVLLVFIILIWLIVLQITVNRLQDRIDCLTATSEKPKDFAPTQSSHKTISLGNAPTPQPTSVPASVAQPKQTIAQPAKPASAGTEAKAPRPTFEFTTAKLFSWIGGFMLFLGCIFGIKYAVENSVLSPVVRIALSTLTGCTLALAGYFIKAPKYRVTAHTLLGSGLAILYAAIFCAHTFYHLIGLASAFIFMALVSFAALGAALKKEAKYVGYLGAVIAFLTPLLLNSGADAWVAFFLYVFCINAAAAYAAARKGWNGLLICTLSFTWLSQAAWLFPLADYKLLGIVTFFSLYALASACLAYRHKAPAPISYAVGGFLLMSLTLMLPVSAGLSSPLLSHLSAALLPSLELLGYVLLVNTFVLVLAGKQCLSYFFARIAKVLSFLILCTWMFAQAAHLPLWMTLGACLLFTALNSGVELLLNKPAYKPDGFCVFYPIGTMLGLFILSLFPAQAVNLNFISIFGMFILLLAAVLLLALLASMLWAALLALGVLFLFLFTCLILGIAGGEVSLCVPLMGFVPLFLCTGIFFALRKSNKLGEISLTEKSIGAVTALTPFVLILTVIAQRSTNLHLHGVLATTFAVCALTALAARLYKNTFTLPAAAVGAGVVQVVLEQLFSAHSVATALTPLGLWAIAILALFILIPFVSKEHFWNKNGTWIACACAGLWACLMGCLLLHDYAPHIVQGSIPAVLFMLYTLLLYKLWGKTITPQASPVQIGFISAVVLVFLTLIFPLQIHNHWLLVAWAAEAVLLMCLHKQLPYPGWKIVAAGLLCIVSVWLLLSGDFTPIPLKPIWNWYLWIYGLCAAALFATAYLWQKPTGWKNAFYALFGCVLFWLVNIEIAHWFHTGKYLHFAFTGQVAQALTYTLAWALFAVCTIGIGLRWQKSAVSKAGIGVMGLALLKFFLSDIWQLQAIYRIIGLFGLAVMLIVASFWYQKKQKTQ